MCESYVDDRRNYKTAGSIMEEWSLSGSLWGTVILCTLIKFWIIHWSTEKVQHNSDVLALDLWALQWNDTYGKITWARNFIEFLLLNETQISALLDSTPVWAYSSSEESTFWRRKKKATNSRPTCVQSVTINHTIMCKTHKVVVQINCKRMERVQFIFYYFAQ